MAYTSFRPAAVSPPGEVCSKVIQRCVVGVTCESDDCHGIPGSAVRKRVEQHLIALYHTISLQLRELRTAFALQISAERGAVGRGIAIGDEQTQRTATAGIRSGTRVDHQCGYRYCRQKKGQSPVHEASESAIETARML